MNKRFVVIESAASLDSVYIEDLSTGAALTLSAHWSVEERNRYAHQLASMLNAQENMEDDGK